MSPINTENFFGPSPVESGRGGANFSTEQSVGESFDDHLRQAYQPQASSSCAQRRSNETDSKTHRDERPERSERPERERRERHAEDSSGSDGVAERRDDSIADDKNASSQNNSQDDSRSSDSGEINADSGNDRQTDADQTQSPAAGDGETEETQTTSADAELVAQLVAENSQQSLQANQALELSSEQLPSDTSGAQSEQATESMAAESMAAETGLETLTNSGNAAQTAQAKAAADASEVATQESPAETLSNSQGANSQRDGDADYLDVTLDNTGDAKTGSESDAAEEAAHEVASAVNTSAETLTRDVSAQSQVAAADRSVHEKNRQASDRVETNVEGDDRAADAPLAATAAAESDAFKSAQNAVDKIAAIDASDADTADSKATSNQPGQNNIAISQRGADAQEIRSEAASQTAGGEEIDTTDRVRFVQRVAKAFAGLGRDGGTLRMRLHPSELGSLSLEVTVRDGVMTAKMETDTQAAKNILLDNLPALRDRLAQQDIKVQQFDVDYSGGNNDGSPQSADDQQQSNQRFAGRQAASQAAGDAETASEDILHTPHARRLGEAAQLDFVA